MRFKWLSIPVLFAALSAAPLAGGDGDDILGFWFTDGADSKVEIYKCGDTYCGKIVDLKEKVYPADDERGMAGQTKVNRNHPDPSQQNQPLIGLDIMEGFIFNGKIWSGGTIYDPKNGKTYKCKAEFAEDGAKLKVRGYIGISLLGRTTVWERAR